ncbi:unnamed protein product [Rhizophagus irregularis]|nr:unnamed protein product [Rhizophagus irregularis]
MSPVLFVRALYDFESNDASSLSFKTDDIIQVLMQLESGCGMDYVMGERALGFLVIMLPYLTKRVNWINEDEKQVNSSWKVPVNYESPAARDTTSCTSSLSKLSKQFPKNQEPTKNGPVSINLFTTFHQIGILDNINANGQLIKTENNEKSRSDDEIPNELLPQTPTVITPNKSIRFSGSSILMLQNAHEYLTWDTLSQSIDLSIHNLNVAIQENMRQDYPECTSTIVGNVRIMLYATGTVEKDSVAIKKNKES